MCRKHEINEELGTPERNHLKFDTVEERRKKRISELQFSSSREKFAPSRKSMDPAKSRIMALADSKARPLVKPSYSVDKTGSILKKGNKPISGSDPIRRTQGTSVPKKLARGPITHVTEKADKIFAAGENKMSLGDQLFDYYKNAGLQEDILAEKEVAKMAQTPAFKLDPESEKRLSINFYLWNNANLELVLFVFLYIYNYILLKCRIEDIMKKCSSEITLEKIFEKHKGPSTHSFFSREAFDKNVTQGKVDAAVEVLPITLSFV